MGAIGLRAIFLRLRLTSLVDCSMLSFDALRLKRVPMQHKADTDRFLAATGQFLKRSGALGVIEQRDGISVEQVAEIDALMVHGVLPGTSKQ